MTHDPHPRIDPDRLRLLAARGRLMLCGMLVWLAETFGATPIGRAARNLLRADLMALTRGLAGLLVLLALPKLTHVRPAPHAHRPAAAPRGFRRAHRKESLRFATRLLPRTRDLRARIAALAAALDALDLWIERMAAHIARDADLVASLAMVRAPHEACVSPAVLSPAYADSS